ncbi:hypothetical protein [Wolbachia endosymbiont (group A) of Hylaeus communis]|nr:hypothetical protein [Wolbachia endosymbiont (group A) of Hylaeus communis]
MKQSGQCLLYEHCDLRAISAREDVIPVPSTDHLLCNLPSKMNVRTAME